MLTRDPDTFTKRYHLLLESHQSDDCGSLRQALSAQLKSPFLREDMVLLLNQDILNLLEKSRHSKEDLEEVSVSSSHPFVVLSEFEREEQISFPGALGIRITFDPRSTLTSHKLVFSDARSGIHPDHIFTSFHTQSDRISYRVVEVAKSSFGFGAAAVYFF